MRACRMSVFSVTGDTPTDRGEINTTHRHHFRPPRAAVFNRRQHVLRASSQAACWSLSRYVCIVLANMPSEFCGRRRTPASGNGSVTVRQEPDASDLTAATDRSCGTRPVKDSPVNGTSAPVFRLMSDS